MIYPPTFESKIGFDQIREMLLENCLCELGRQLTRDIYFENSSDKLKRELDLTEELRKILLFEENFPQENYIDPTSALRKIKVPGTFVETSELLDVKRSLDTIKALHRFFGSDESKLSYPTICEESANVMLFPIVGEKIDQIINKHGQIKDNASKDLKKIRELIKQKQTAVSRKLLAILKSAQNEGLADQEAEITLREGRPVIPIGANNKRKLGGIVHDESSSGKTVFIEPGEVVELNNEIRELEYAERREIVRILIEFADFIRPYIDSLIDGYYFLGKVDYLRAKAKLALKINGIRPVLQVEPYFNWKNALHPLLYLSHKSEGKKIIPLNVSLNIDNRILLISGPNAGGKSVCLKTIGLLQYMLQCGLLVPMSENSEFCIFSGIFIDIGDEQSIENDLSTYSSHLLNMKYILKQADKKSLILIDEFGAGTEPVLGGAIAEAILTELNTKEVFGVITTHYSNLKHFASETKGLINGAMLFDTQKIEPLYNLAIGKPGSSFAIDIARKIGLPENILKNASEKVGEGYINFEKHLREINRDKKYWEEKRNRIRKVEKMLDNLYTNYSSELEGIQNERKKILSQAKSEAEELLKNVNRQIEGTIREIKETNARNDKTREARSKLDEFRKELANNDFNSVTFDDKIKEIQKEGLKLVKHNPELTKLKGIDKDHIISAQLQLEVGKKIRIKGMETEGEIIEINDKNILVAFGNMITSIDYDRVESVADSKHSNKISKPSFNSALNERKLRFKPEIDIRGKRGDEAIELVKELIDDATMLSVSRLRILHGKGNGILRQLIRDYLDTLNLVKSARDEHVDMGGAGITVVEMDY